MQNVEARKVEIVPASQVVPLDSKPDPVADIKKDKADEVESKFERKKRDKPKKTIVIQQ